MNKPLSLILVLGLGMTLSGCGNALNGAKQDAVTNTQKTQQAASDAAASTKAAADQAAKTDIGWGHQIRSYVLQPYQMVKDLRTGVVSTAPDQVLDGDLDPFIEASLKQGV